MMPAAATPPASRDTAGSSFSRWLLCVVLAAGALVYAGFIAMNVGAYAAGSDSSGYLNNARLLRDGRISTPARVLPGLPTEQAPSYLYVPLGFKPAGPGKIVPTYPFGLSLLVNATAVLTGSSLAPNWTLWWHALAGVGLMFLLGRLAGLPPGWAGLGALLMAACPLHVLFSLQMMSDVPATTWATATVALAWLSRTNVRWAPLAGFALGFAVLVRPTNLLIALPAALALGTARRRWLGFVLGGAPAALGLLLYNWRAYGHPLENGYGGAGGLFEWSNVPVTLAHYAAWLPMLLTPLGLLALGLPLCARQLPRWTALLSVWLLSYLALYASYYNTHETWWYLRFVLPAFPAAWVAALLVAREILRRIGWEKLAPVGSLGAWLVGTLAAAAIFLYAAKWNRHFFTAEAGRGERVYAEAAEWLQKQVPANAVIVAMQTSGTLFYYTDHAILRWDQIHEKDFEQVARAAIAAGRPLFALLEPFEVERIFAEKRVTGHWAQIGAVKEISLWRFDPPAP